MRARPPRCGHRASTPCPSTAGDFAWVISRSNGRACAIDRRRLCHATLLTWRDDGRGKTLRVGTIQRCHRSPFGTRFHQRLRIGRPARHQDQRHDRQQVGQHQVELVRQHRVAGLLRRSCSASKNANSSAPTSALPGRQSREHHQRHADPAAAVDHVEEEGVERGQVRNAGHAHQRRAGHDRAGARAGPTRPGLRPPAGSRPPCATPARWVRYSSHAISGTRRRAQAGSAASARRTPG